MARWRALIAVALLVLAATTVHAASGLEPAPPGAPANAPAQYTKFTAGELSRGFLALAFGSDLRIGARPKGLRRFDHPISVFVESAGSTDRKAAMEAIVKNYGGKIPNLSMSTAANADGANVVIHLIDEKNFKGALRSAFGRATTRAFVTRTNPQCMTSVKSQANGSIVQSVSFVIVDKGDGVFFDCGYHEMLHALGLSNHDQSNPWTTLNQTRSVGYLDAYDRAMLTLLYDPRLNPGMSQVEVRKALPALVQELTAGQ